MLWQFSFNSREHLRLVRRMFWLELSLEHPNSLKVAIFALKSICWSCKISNLPSQEIAITLLNQLVSVARPSVASVAE